MAEITQEVLDKIKADNTTPTVVEFKRRRAVSECFGETSGTCDDYDTVSAYGKLYAAHRLSLSLKLNRPLTQDEHCCHLCSVPPCFNPDCLVVGDDTVNMRHASQAGTLGSKNLSHTTKMKIVELRDAGKSARSVAERFKLTRRTVDRIYEANCGLGERVSGDSRTIDDFARRWFHRAEGKEVAARVRAELGEECRANTFNSRWTRWRGKIARMRKEGVVDAAIAEALKIKVSQLDKPK